MTIDEILQSAHRKYDGSIDYPTSSEDDYKVRLGVIQDLVREWGSEPIDWKELYTSGSITADGTSEQDLPSDFNHINGNVSVGGTMYEFRKPEEISQQISDDSGSTFFSVYGTPGSYKLYIYPTPSSGTAITFHYYKNPTIPTVGTDVIEMSDPLFLRDGLISFMYEQDSRSGKATEYNNKKVDRLNTMVINNEVRPNYNSETLL